MPMFATSQLSPVCPGPTRTFFAPRKPQFDSTPVYFLSTICTPFQQPHHISTTMNLGSLQKLTPEEHEVCFQEGCCLCYHQKGHNKNFCSIFTKVNQLGPDSISFNESVIDTTLK
eukprot:Phypoly_transcript_06172.p1 GENE.Phypoly_transcript_06172~~Phypoly_transcript_06172.p1  ORF type:complete len:115 (-),score=3.09 Phypoly_transcript_06172:134-478(-)